MSKKFKKKIEDVDKREYRMNNSGKMASNGIGGGAIGVFLAVVFSITCPEYGEYLLTFI